MGIDRDRILNKLPAQTSNLPTNLLGMKSFMGGLRGNKVKKASRMIADIGEVGHCKESNPGLTMFYIHFKTDSARHVYDARSKEECDEIVAKLSFLMTLQI